MPPMLKSKLWTTTADARQPLSGNFQLEATDNAGNRGTLTLNL